MPCERQGCGHPLAVHDPCSICGCAGYQPEDRKIRAAMLTDIGTGVPTTKAGLNAWVKELREKEATRGIQ